MTKCNYDPKEVKGAIGMFHCPECGDMVVAGFEHPSMDDEKIDEYFDGQYEKFKSYILKHTGQYVHDFFFMMTDSMPNMKGTLLEIWLRAEPSFRDEQVF